MYILHASINKNQYLILNDSPENTNDIAHSNKELIATFPVSFKMTASEIVAELNRLNNIIMSLKNEIVDIEDGHEMDIRDFNDGNI